MSERNIFEIMLDNLTDGVYFTDRNRIITYWNDTAEELTGYSREEALGTLCKEGLLAHVDERGLALCHDHCPIVAALEDGETHHIEAYLHHKAGHLVPVHVRVAPVRATGNGGDITGVVQVFSDNSPTLAARQRIQQLEGLALLDDLTGLPNRRYVVRELTSRLVEMSRLGESFGVLFADIDDLKDVNDRHGHDAGDEVLCVVGRTFVHNCRPLDVIGRWGGDEFVCVIRDADRGTLRMIAERFRVLIENSSITRAGKKVQVTISTGGVISRPGDSPESILERADQMLYRSKDAGKNLVSIRDK
ncbi:GGDEF domain-containing protein [bacterium]|nr:GGDEF domain-containing protein [bacterium]